MTTPGICIVLTNQKGGVTKTTTAANVAMMLTFAGKRVLVADCDPQGNLTYTFGYTPDLFPHTLYNVLKGEEALQNIILPTYFDPASTQFINPYGQNDLTQAPTIPDDAIRGPDLIPINIVASSADGELQSNPSWGTLLRRKLRAVRSQYDYIIIDTNPGLGKLTINALCAADYVCIPLTPEVLPTQGLVSLSKSIEEARESEANPDIKIAGILFTRVRHNYKTHTEIMQFVRNDLAPQLGISCFNTEIKDSAVFLNAASQRSVVVVAEPEGDHALTYWQFLSELIQSINGPGLGEIRQTHQRLLQAKQERERVRQERIDAKKAKRG